MVDPIRFITIVMSGVIALAGCGDGSNSPQLDAAQQNRLRHLAILEPGTEIGLNSGATSTLGVRYEESTGEPIANEQVAFELIARNSTGAGGASISAALVNTNAFGVAKIELQAGPESASFRVLATALDAAEATFYVAVSDTGFAEISAAVHYDGWRPRETLAAPELRLFDADAVRCASWHVDDPPDSSFPPRTAPGLDEAISYPFVLAQRPYTLTAWIRSQLSGRALAAGCIDVGAGQIPPLEVNLNVAVADSPHVLASETEITTVVDLSPVRNALEAAGSEDDWNTLRCEAGLGQALLDCTLDALVPDGTLDCVATSTNSLADAIQAKRGSLNGMKCRSKFANGPPSVDSLLHNAVVGTAFPVGTDLANMLDIRIATLTQLKLRSQLSAAPHHASHKLVDLLVDIGDDYSVVPLAETNRPILTQTAIPYTHTPGEPGALHLSPHGFTLQFGRATRTVFATTALAPLGLDDSVNELGSALASAVADEPSGTTGCAAVSNIVCNAVGQAANCVLSACESGHLALNANLSESWQRLQSTGEDFEFAGELSTSDSDEDLLLEVTTEGPTGWRATMKLSDGTIVLLQAFLAQDG